MGEGSFGDAFCTYLVYLVSRDRILLTVKTLHGFQPMGRDPSGNPLSPKLFTLRLITLTKLQLWSSHENSSMVGGHTTWRSVSKGCSIGKAEKHWVEEMEMTWPPSLNLVSVAGDEIERLIQMSREGQGQGLGQMSLKQIPCSAWLHGYMGCWQANTFLKGSRKNSFHLNLPTWNC